jgi:adenylate cyclase
LHDAGAAVVGFDLKFAGPSADNGTSEAAPNADQLFAEAIGRMPVVIGFTMTDTSGNGLPLQKGRIAFVSRGGANPSLKLYRYPEATVDPPLLQAAAAGIGFANVLVDDDGVIRRVPLVARLADKPVPSFAAEIIRVARGIPFYSCLGDWYGLERIMIGAVPVRTGEAGDIWLRYIPLRPDRFIHAADVLSGNFDHARIAGQIVLVGVSAKSLGDQWPTPLHQTMPGVEILTQEIEQILSASSLSRPGWARGAEILFAFAGCLLVVIASCFGAVWLITTAGLLLLSAAAFSWLGLINYQIVFDWVAPVLAIGLAAFTASILARRRPVIPIVRKS